MPNSDNPYGEDAPLGRGRTLLNLIAEGYDGAQIGERYDISPERAEELILLYVRRVLRGDIPPAPAAECQISGFDGWCFKHGCHHPAPDNRPDPTRPACTCCGRRVAPLDDDGRCGYCGANRNSGTHNGDQPCRLASDSAPNSTGGEA